MPHRKPCIGIMLLVAALSTGCAAHLQTRTVQDGDTYDLWAARMEHMPFVFHEPDGHVDVYDVRGNAWTGPTNGLKDGSADRVEVYEGHFAAATGTMCMPSASALAAGNAAGSANVVAAICDRGRTVVSFSDKVRARVLDTKTEYVPRVRHLLLEGIWESVAQEPAPLHT
ncbi:hypothetical protein [Luteibacter sp. SG786]|uniref:hypothetical protein n=1 Tax=Luteibacter sp. SG786 TaxID=2587130 RepID=UPI00142118C3|nr:hypothetical protein [Luteibacter sp. SG786]NII56218.1 hypothetical protein [Luteibacter sp. SG786]